MYRDSQRGRRDVRAHTDSLMAAASVREREGSDFPESAGRPTGEGTERERH